ncbi:MAG: hypothetical protein CL568_01405 [Alphaproteobacteria bacterium]|jgi:hypothetical protein|nr:hypothetical protein [Alphaproteobacteria bacterium]PPR13469.1 MAG: hypothetical protein CFH42_01221 [Alphaproteobacteria bacterium MarineAlpha12_Bin1]|tara:strand:- start:2935 stop:3141 length:207 start_codon:yes stop_codon:yes gene_type:complete
MFGFSPGKIAVLAIILIVVIYGAKIVTRKIKVSDSDSDSGDENHVDTVYDSETDSYVVKVKDEQSDKE